MNKLMSIGIILCILLTLVGCANKQIFYYELLSEEDPYVDCGEDICLDGSTSREIWGKEYFIIDSGSKEFYGLEEFKEWFFSYSKDFDCGSYRIMDNGGYPIEEVFNYHCRTGLTLDEVKLNESRNITAEELVNLYNNSLQKEKDNELGDVGKIMFETYFNNCSNVKDWIKDNQLRCWQSGEVEDFHKDQDCMNICLKPEHWDIFWRTKWE